MRREKCQCHEKLKDTDNIRPDTKDAGRASSSSPGQADGCAAAAPAPPAGFPRAEICSGTSGSRETALGAPSAAHSPTSKHIQSAASLSHLQFLQLPSQIQRAVWKHRGTDSLTPSGAVMPYALRPTQAGKGPAPAPSELTIFPENGESSG